MLTSQQSGNTLTVMDQTEKFLHFFATINNLNRQINRFKSFYMEGKGLKGADLPVLLALNKAESGFRFDECCQIVRMDKALISRSLKHLKEQDLLVIEGETTYKVRFKLSKKGKQLTSYLEQEASSVFEKAHLAIDEKEWETFYTFCSTLSEEIETQMKDKIEASKQATAKEEQSK